MGAACTSDKYRQLREEYGLELTKMVIGEKNKLFLDRIIGKLKQEIQEYARKAEDNANASLGNAEATIKQFYGRVREELDRRQPGGVKSLEQMSGTTAEELMGYAFVRGLLGELRANVETRFKEEEHALIGELVDIKSSQEELFNSERASMPLYSQMEADERESVLKRGEMEFHDLVVKYEEHILSRYGHKLEPEYYVARFNNIDPSESLDGLLFLAKDKFVTSLNLILAQKIDSYILFEDI